MDQVVKTLEQQKENYVIKFEEIRNKIGEEWWYGGNTLLLILTCTCTCTVHVHVINNYNTE